MEGLCLDFVLKFEDSGELGILALGVCFPSPEGGRFLSLLGFDPVDLPKS